MIELWILWLVVAAYLVWRDELWRWPLSLLPGRELSEQQPTEGYEPPDEITPSGADMERVRYQVDEHRQTLEHLKEHVTSLESQLEVAQADLDHVAQMAVDLERTVSELDTPDGTPEELRESFRRLGRTVGLLWSMMEHVIHGRREQFEYEGQVAVYAIADEDANAESLLRTIEGATTVRVSTVCGLASAYVGPDTDPPESIEGALYLLGIRPRIQRNRIAASYHLGDPVNLWTT